jgi:hypothetical protein
MSTPMRFDELLEVIGNLPPDDQETMLAILERRQIAQRRAVLAKDIQEARQEFQSAGCLPQTAKDLMNEVLS